LKDYREKATCHFRGRTGKKIVGFMDNIKDYADLEDQAGDETTSNGLMGIGLLKLNPAFLFNIWSAITLPTLYFDTTDSFVN
jgi:hypothetical protein